MRPVSYIQLRWAGLKKAHRDDASAEILTAASKEVCSGDVVVVVVVDAGSCTHDKIIHKILYTTLRTKY